MSELKQAEARGYSKGYTAGKRRMGKQISAAQLQVKRDAFWNRAFLAAIPFAMTQNTWKFGKNPINTLEERMSFASRVADAAMKRFK